MTLLRSLVRPLYSTSNGPLCQRMDLDIDEAAVVFSAEANERNREVTTIPQRCVQRREIDASVAAE